MRHASAGVCAFRASSFGLFFIYKIHTHRQRLCKVYIQTHVMLDKECSPLCDMHCLVCVLSGPVALVCTLSMKTLHPTLPCNRQVLMGLPSPTTLEQVCSFSHSVKLTFSVKAQAWKRLGYAIFRGSLAEFLRGKNISAEKRLSDIYVNVPFWVLSPCVKGTFSFLCFVYWWLIKTDLIWLCFCTASWPCAAAALWWDASARTFHWNDWNYLVQLQ